RQVVARAPVMLDSLCDGCRTHFAEVRALVEQERVPYVVNPRLVRGLDYYCRTAFEVVSGLLGAQNAVGGGGRYDGLVAALGGPDVPGLGFALGLERLATVAAEQAAPPGPVAVVLPLEARAGAPAPALTTRLRHEGLPVVPHPAGRPPKAPPPAAHPPNGRTAP